MAEPDWTDPCAVLAWLKPQYYRVAAGRQSVQLRSGDRAVTYGQADIARLDALMARLKRDCMARQGKPARRHVRAYVSDKGY